MTNDDKENIPTPFNLSAILKGSIDFNTVLILVAQLGRISLYIPGDGLMVKVWKTLDARYRQPIIVSRKLIRELLDLKFSSTAKQDCHKFIKVHSAYVRIRNDLKEIGMLDCPKHGPTIDSIVRKLLGHEYKNRWAV